MNKVTLIGRLTKDPELRYTQNGTAVSSFTLAVGRRKTGNDNGPAADFIPCIAWGKLGEVVANNLIKGRKIAVEGRLQVRSYEAQDGTKRYVTEVVAGEVEFLGSKTDSGNASADSGGFGGTPANDDDIPF